MQRKNYTRIIALVISVCMLAGIAVGIFVVFPPLLPILAVAGAAVYFLYRYKRVRRGGRAKGARHK